MLVRRFLRLSLLIVVASNVMPSSPVTAAARTSCQGSPATLIGTERDDELRGTRGVDVIAGLGGDDVISGLRGADLLCGGRGKDRVRGGAGHDSVVGDGGADILQGGGGADFFSPPRERGRDVLDGGKGNDFLFFNKAPGAVEVDLAAGFYRIGAQAERLVSGSFETVYGSHYPDQIMGDDEHNVLFSGFDSYGDTLRGRGGNDYLEGYEGPDFLFGDEGDDVISGLYGGDEVDGGPGRDLIRMCGHFSKNVSTCGNGSPVPDRGVVVDLAAGTLGGEGGATLAGIEDVEGTGTRDDIRGSDGANRIYGGPRADLLSGGGGDDVLVGDGQAPLPPPLHRRLNEGELSGPDGGDALDGGEGQDSLDGNGGDDVCVNGEQVINCETQDGWAQRSRTGFHSMSAHGPWWTNHSFFRSLASDLR